MKTKKQFTFDHAIWSANSNDDNFVGQEEMYEKLGKQVLDNAFKGYNASLFAYGQTGSGKSYSTYGSDKEPGIIPRLCGELYERIKKKQKKDPKTTYRVEVSMIEIYKEKVRDLFNPQNPQNQGGLKVREHVKKGPYVEGLSQSLVSSKEEMMAVLKEGSQMRTIASTNMNNHSSRAHTIFQILFTQTAKAGVKNIEKQSVISLIDLAGSERQGKAKTSGERLKEGAAINLSLTTLGNVINALADQKSSSGFIPYRNSTLTYLLKESLGGNSKTIMIATISPAQYNEEETLSTLRYANRAKNIKNRAKVNQDETSKIIASLKDEIDRLKSQMGTGGDDGRFADLEAQLRESQLLIERYQKSEAELKLETENYRKAREKVIHEAGLDIEERKTVPHFVNLRELSVDECLLYFFEKGSKTIIGSDAKIAQVVLSDALLPKHAIIIHKQGKIELQPHGPTFVNGKRVIAPIFLNTSDRVMAGPHAFRFVNPAQPSTLDEVVDWNFAREEFDRALEDEKKAHQRELKDEIQAERAKQEEILRLEFEKKRSQQNLEVNALVKQRAKLLQEINEAKQAQLESLNNQEANMLERHQLEVEVEQFQSQLSRELEFKKKLEKDNAKNVAKAREMQSMVAALRNQLESEAREKQKIQDAHQRLQQETKSYQQNLEQLQYDLSRAESKRAQQEELHAKLRETVESQRKQSESLNEQIAKLDEDHHKMVMRNTALEHDVRLSKEKHEAVQTKFNNHLHQMDDLLPLLQSMILTEQKENKKMRRQFENDLSVKTIEIRELKDKLKKIERQHQINQDDVRAKYDHASLRQNELKEEVRKLRENDKKIRSKYAQLHAEYTNLYAIKVDLQSKLKARGQSS
eukprot:CAMPEP_0117430020 /NCGR_PEP_ID=MMETSP0758-20121206/9541_1 /TAXON_ID=63605 /ORGANISM="Percolomonas cosmopolitus, Strain AE-1 (ATCC 50343)" /LENGTH=864 /DNA_ID=CAMNT_0005217585 /DNA_START=188 /DNA_END=2782 /DNA_ORIENTATION=+